MTAIDRSRLPAAELPDAAPHTGVVTRLGVSAIDGVGVFAIADIAAGTDPFASDRRDIVWIDAALVEALPEGSPLRRLYLDFGIRRGDRIGCPPSFDLLGTGWYVNEPPPGVAANIGVDDRFAFAARRDIAAGEELTVDYAGFSDLPAEPRRLASIRESDGR